MSASSKLRQVIMAYYHKNILNFYSSTGKTFDLPHMYFNDIKDPKLILHDDTPIFIGRIEVDKEGISNFIHDTPITFDCDEACETISMQDFIVHGRLPSLSTIRQSNHDSKDKKYYVYQTIAGQKSELQEIFPLLRAQSSQTSYLLRGHLNRLLNNEEKQIQIHLDEHPDEFEWIRQNDTRFDDVCNRLQIALFKTPTQIILTRYANTDEIDL